MQKNATPKNWHRADIVAALKKKGWSLRALSMEAGVPPNTLRGALAAPCLKGERFIAAAIGVKPEEIWPERYAARNLKPVFPKKVVNG